MKIKVTDEFKADMDTVIDTAHDPAFHKRLEALPGLSGYQVLSTKEDAADRLVTRTKCTGGGSLTDALRRFTSEEIYWIEEAAYDKQNRVIDFKWEVPSFKDVRIKGVRKFTYTGGVTRREITAEVKVGMPLIGGIVEKILCNQMEKNFRLMGEAIKTHIKENANIS